MKAGKKKGKRVKSETGKKSKGFTRELKNTRQRKSIKNQSATLLVRVLTKYCRYIHTSTLVLKDSFNCSLSASSSSSALISLAFSQDSSVRSSGFVRRQDGIGNGGNLKPH